MLTNGHGVGSSFGADQRHLRVEQNHIGSCQLFGRRRGRCRIKNHSVAVGKDEDIISSGFTSRVSAFVSSHGRKPLDTGWKTRRGKKVSGNYPIVGEDWQRRGSEGLLQREWHQPGTNCAVRGLEVRCVRRMQEGSKGGEFVCALTRTCVASVWCGGLCGPCYGCGDLLWYELVCRRSTGSML